MAVRVNEGLGTVDGSSEMPPLGRPGADSQPKLDDEHTESPGNECGSGVGDVDYPAGRPGGNLLSDFADASMLILSWRWTRAVCVAGFSVIAFVAIVQNAPLAWDESVFATRARDVMNSNFSFDVRSGIYWGDHRPPGLPLLLAGPFWLLGPSDLVARSVIVALGAIGLVLVGRLVDVFFSRHVGTFVVALTAFCPGVLAAGSMIFGDVPSIPFVALALIGLSRALVDRQDVWLLLVPPSLTVATVVRYGSAMLIAAPLAILGLWFLYDRLVHHNIWSVCRLLATAATSLVGIAVVLYTTLFTRNVSPAAATRALGETNGGDPGRWRQDLSDILQPGPVDYGFGGSFWGLSYSALFCLSATAAGLLLVFRRKWLRLLFAVSIAATPVALYAVTVNQFVTTYFAPIFVSWAVAVAIGLFPGETVTRPSGSASTAPPRTVEHRGGRTTLALVAIVLLIAGGVIVSSARATRTMHDRLYGFDSTRSASLIAGDLLGRSCALGTVRYPQVAWYSECSTVSLGGLNGLFDGTNDDAEVAELLRRAGAVDVVGVLIVEGIGGQPNIDFAVESLDPGSSVVLTSEGGRRVVVGAVAP